MPQASGVYCITNINTGEKYIGASVNMQKRCRMRFSEMRTSVSAGALYDAYKIHGLDALTCFALLICAPEHLRFYEGRAIETLKPAYNRLPSIASSRWPKQNDLTPNCPTCGCALTRSQVDRIVAQSSKPGPKSKRLDLIKQVL